MKRLKFGLLMILSVFFLTAPTAMADDYYVYSRFVPPGVTGVGNAGGYVEDYGVASTWGDEIQYVYFIGRSHYKIYAYKAKVWLTNHGGSDDPTTYIDPLQHPDNPDHTGPIEPRHFKIVAGPVDMTGMTNYTAGEFQADSTGVYIGATGGIHKFDHNLNYIGKVAPAFYGESLSYNSFKKTWYAGKMRRRIYQLRDTDDDGDWMDETWQYIFTHANYRGSHHDGMEYVSGFLYISDMTSDVIAKWGYDSVSNKWNELARYAYREAGYVEGMGFGPNGTFWITTGGVPSAYLYEIGGEITKDPVADAGKDVVAYAPTITVMLDGSGSYHPDPKRKIILYEWDCEGDGIYDYSGTDPVTTCTYPAVYNPDGSINWAMTAHTYAATLKVTDNTPALEGGPKISVDTCEVHITAPPWQPIADPNGPYNPVVNTDVCLDGSGSYHPAASMYAPGHSSYDNIVAWEWDLDNDGVFDDAAGAIACTRWTTEGTYFVCLRVTDGAGKTDKKCTTVVVGTGIHDVAVKSIASSKESGICPGEAVTIGVDVSNLGNYTENFDVTATYGGVVIDTKSVVSLIDGGNESLSFSWNTTGVAEGKYTIKACTGTVPGEIVVDNNCFEMTVEVGCILCGDLDNDGDVDGNDRDILRNAFRTSIGDRGYVPEADYDKDGDIDFNDYREWYKCYKAFIKS